MRRLVILMGVWMGAWAMVCGAAPNQTKADLLLSAQTARPGSTLMAGVRLRMAEGWHTYWVNPGEAGKATEIEWTLPAGVTAGPIQWPVPEKYDWVGLFNYVYHGEALLFVPISISADAAPGARTIKAKVSWLECKEQCVPGEATVEARFEVGETAVPGAGSAVINAALGKLPRLWPGPPVVAAWSAAAEENKRPLTLAWDKQNAEAAKFDFYPHGYEDFVVEPGTEVLSAEGGGVKLGKVIEKYGEAWPSELSGLLVEQLGDGRLVAAYQVSVKLGQTQSRAAGSIEAAGSGRDVSLLAMLGLAFLGGLILNIMPCVLPVIALKILGFVNQSKESPGRVKQLGWIYALGVVASFLVLAGMVIGVQKAGKIASWGMQFGNPYFLVAITLVVVLVALNLFGVFEVTLGGRTLGAAGALTSREGSSGAFFNGILATALATPCTAPFLSVALGFAFTQTPAIIVLMFAMTAAGLAAPYVILSWKPGWLRFLPKPGAWMERFKQAMGFPMLATAIWLFSIITAHFGDEGILWVGVFFVSVACAAWIWGEFVQRVRRRPGVAMAVSVALVLGSYWFALENQLQWRQPRAVVDLAGGQTGEVIGGENAIRWQPWSPEAVAKARSQGHPVLVDFTAKWCATCQWNKKTSLEIESVGRKLREIDAVTLRADNTLVRADIAEELAKFGRAGVPLVLVYPKDAAQPPLVLPELLTPSIVLDALDKASPSAGANESRLEKNGPLYSTQSSQSTTQN